MSAQRSNDANKRNETARESDATSYHTYYGHRISDTSKPASMETGTAMNIDARDDSSSNSATDNRLTASRPIVLSPSESCYYDPSCAQHVYHDTSFAGHNSCGLCFGQVQPDLHAAYSDALRKIEALSHELSDAQAYVLRKEQEFSNVITQTQQHMRRHNEDLAREHADMKRQLLIATNDLASLRSLTAGYAGDSQGLCTQFEDLVDAVNDFAFTMISGLNIVDAPLTAAHISAIKDSNLGDRFLRPFLRQCEMHGCSIEGALIPITQALVVHSAYFGIIHPFALGQKKDQSDYCLKLYEWIKRQGLQEHRVRWRATTYKAIRDSSRDAGEQAIARIVDELMKALGTIVSICSASDISKSRQDVLNIMSMVVKWQDKAQGTPFTFDYTPFLPAPNVEYAAAAMEQEDFASTKPVEKPKRSPRVVLPMGMGLRAGRTEEDGNGAMVRTTKIIRKAIVICADSED